MQGIPFAFTPDRKYRMRLDLVMREGVSKRHDLVEGVAFQAKVKFLSDGRCDFHLGAHRHDRAVENDIPEEVEWFLSWNAEILNHLIQDVLNQRGAIDDMDEVGFFWHIEAETIGM